MPFPDPRDRRIFDDRNPPTGGEFHTTPSDLSDDAGYLSPRARVTVRYPAAECAVRFSASNDHTRG